MKNSYTTCLVPGGCTRLVRGGYLVWGGSTCLVLRGCTCLVWGGVYLVWGVYLPGLEGCTWSWGGVPGPGGTCLVPGGYLPGLGGPGQVLPPVNRMTNTCKNITLAKTSFRPVIKCQKVSTKADQNIVLLAPFPASAAAENFIALKIISSFEWSLPCPRWHQPEAVKQFSLDYRLLC